MRLSSFVEPIRTTLPSRSNGSPVDKSKQSSFAVRPRHKGQQNVTNRASTTVLRSGAPGWLLPVGLVDRMKLAARLPWLVLPALLLAASCFPEPGPKDAIKPRSTLTDAGSDASQETTTRIGQCPPELKPRTAPEGAKCQSAKTGEALPARRIVSDRNAAKADVQYFTDDLFALFKSHCGGCHVEQSQGNLNVTRTNFSTKINEEVLARIRENDPDKYMPPGGSGGKPWDDRAEGDPIRRLVALIELWMTAGSPADYFILPASQGGTSPFFMDEALAQSLTNVGTCVPDPELVATAQEKSCDIDVRFAEMRKRSASEPGGAPEDYIGLPKRLEETDLHDVRFGGARPARRHRLCADLSAVVGRCR